jgi:hypothetical protein
VELLLVERSFLASSIKLTALSNLAKSEGSVLGEADEPTLCKVLS